MSVDQYQRKVNSLDHDIQRLEQKRALADRKAADENKKATSVSVRKNASASTIKSKMNEIERHRTASNQAAKESADLARQIAQKRKQRNDAYLRLQKEQQSENKKQEREITNLKRAYEQHIAELSREMRPQMLLQDEMDKNSEYDVFVSHAWEDKDSFVDEFVRELLELKLTVWYDSKEIKWGDSMRKRIDAGLRKSKFGVVVLSPNYIADGKYWTKAELDGLFQLESINGKTMLPIWHNLTKKDVMNYSPIIASKLAMTTASYTPREIAEELHKLLVNDRSEGEPAKYNEGGSRDIITL